MEPVSKILMTVAAVLVAGVVIVGGIIVINGMNNDDSNGAASSSWQQIVSKLDEKGGTVFVEGGSTGSGASNYSTPIYVNASQDAKIIGDFLVISNYYGNDIWIPLDHVLRFSIAAES